MWKLLQDKPNQSWRDLEEAKTERSQQSREIGERLMMFCKRQQDGSVDSAEDNKDADGSMDSVRQRDSIICTHTWSKD